MGLALGLGKGLQYRQRIISSPANTYVSAAIAAGGTVDSKACVKSTFDALAAVSISMYTQAKAYETAALADGGTIDSFSCVRSTFTELNNVTT
jgi:hypothetical protein